MKVGEHDDFEKAKEILEKLNTRNVSNVRVMVSCAYSF